MRLPIFLLLHFFFFWKELGRREAAHLNQIRLLSGSCSNDTFQTPASYYISPDTLKELELDWIFISSLGKTP